MTTTSMIGKWEGEYNYTKRKKDRSMIPSPVKFEVEILSQKDEFFNGIVEDKSKVGGTPGIGELSGTIKGTNVIFEKNMPIEVMHFQNGDRRINNNRKHPTIFYSGSLDKDNMTISGEWNFGKLKFMWVGIIPWWYDLGSGTFTMHKIK